MINLWLNKIIHGHVLDLFGRLPDNCIHCAVTSPPYWGLRDYGLPPQVWGGDPGCEHEWGSVIQAINSGGGWNDPEKRSNYPPMRLKNPKKERKREVSQGQFCHHCGAWFGSLGLEPAPELYVEHIVEISREVRRVLRKDGTLWLNMGDSYAGNASRGGGDPILNKGRNLGGSKYPKAIIPEGLKSKDLCEIPSDVARALREDGWYLRSRIPWLKRNSMPGSEKDRPSGSGSTVEYVFLLTKSKKYFYDNEAIKQPASINTHSRGNGVNPKARKAPTGWDAGPGGHGRLKGRYPKSKQNASFSGAVNKVVANRNRRPSDWFFESWQGLYEEDGDPLAFIVNPVGYKEAHFATFPGGLVRPMILAGTSEKGACAECGAPWERVVENEPMKMRRSNRGKALGEYGRTAPSGTMVKAAQAKTLGWQSTCTCNAETKPCIVLDPFVGSGTVAVMATRLRRDFVGLELNPEYIKMAEKRLEPFKNQLKLTLV